MANGTDVHPQEIKLWRRWYEVYRRRAESDPDYAEFSGRAVRRSAGAAEFIAIRDQLAADNDLDRFRSDLQAWGVRHSHEGFGKGRWGMPLVGFLVQRAEEPAELARLLADGLSAPRDSSSAAQKIDALAEYAERFKAGGHIKPMHARVLLPYFWKMVPDARWPVLWWSRVRFMEFITGEPWASPSRAPEGWPGQGSGSFYLRYVDRVRDLDKDTDRFEVVVDWWSNKNPVFLDPVLAERCTFGFDPDAISADALRRNADALVAFARYLGAELADDLSKALDRPLGYRASPTLVKFITGRPRSDFWVDWRFEYNVGNKRLWQGMGLRLGMNHKGVAIGIVPGWYNRAWYDKICEFIKAEKPEDFDEITVRDDLPEDERGFLWPLFEPSYSIFGRWYELDRISDLDLRAEAIEVASVARPTIESMVDWARRVWYPGCPNPPSPPPPPNGTCQRIEEAAEELLVDSSFLYDIKSLLKDKGQVILYGPPGTGKTYLAKRLAEALAPDPDFRSLVQFHPSTSYEDFFEGYRPVPGADGRIAYELTRGPLARMAAHDEGHPGRHVMVIDEINRANLPRVLGELLFLFEYRGERVSTLYRSDGEFHLPESLWFIGTMNTADRSIALVDAALRRRFHFVPFFPGRGPTEGLLGRWLEREGEPGWVDGLVAMVNRELTEAVGEDLQLGFSHFMRRGYREEPSEDDETLRRIWQYNIEPFVEDQLFGDRARIERFRFEKVIARYRSKLKPDDSSEDGADGGGSDEAQSD